MPLSLLRYRSYVSDINFVTAPDTKIPDRTLSRRVNAFSLLLQFESVWDLVVIHLAGTDALRAVLSAGADSCLPVFDDLPHRKEYGSCKQQGDENISSHVCLLFLEI